MMHILPLDKETTHIDVKLSSRSNLINAMHITSKQSLHITGILPDDLYPFVYIGKSKGHRLWHGIRLESCAIVTKGNKNDVDAVVFESADIRLLLVSKCLIEKFLKDLYNEDELSQYYQFNAYELNNKDLEVFLEIHNSILDNKEILESKLKSCLLNLLQNPVKKDDNVNKQYALTKQAIDIMKQNIEVPIKIKELATILNISQRNLELVFNKYIKISPKSYYQRLLLLHIEMKLRNQQSTSVTEVIEKFQIYNLSQFGASFKKYFNKTPSDTLTAKEKYNPFGWDEEIFLRFSQE